MRGTSFQRRRLRTSENSLKCTSARTCMCSKNSTRSSDCILVIHRLVRQAPCNRNGFQSRPRISDRPFSRVTRVLRVHTCVPARVLSRRRGVHEQISRTRSRESSRFIARGWLIVEIRPRLVSISRCFHVLREFSRVSGSLIFCDVRA